MIKNRSLLFALLAAALCLLLCCCGTKTPDPAGDTQVKDIPATDLPTTDIPQLDLPADPAGDIRIVSGENSVIPLACMVWAESVDENGHGVTADGLGAEWAFLPAQGNGAGIPELVYEKTLDSVIPSGTKITGVVTAVQQDGKLERTGTSFAALSALPAGRYYVIVTTETEYKGETTSIRNCYERLFLLIKEKSSGIPEESEGTPVFIGDLG